MISGSSLPIKTWANTLLHTNILKIEVREDEGNTQVLSFHSFPDCLSFAFIPINPVSFSPGKLLKMDIAWFRVERGQAPLASAQSCGIFH